MSIKDKMGKEMIKMMSKMAEKNLKEYLDGMIDKAEKVLMDLKAYRTKINNEEYMKHNKIEDMVSWAINKVQQINWHFDDGADVIGKYMYMKAKRGE